MQKLPKIGLPVILLIVVVLIFISKSSINIGYGEAGVLFKTFGWFCLEAAEHVVHPSA